MVLGDDAAAGEAERVLEQDADGEGEAVELGDALFGQGVEPVDGGGGEFGSGAEWIGGHRGSVLSWGKYRGTAPPHRTTRR